MNAEYWIANFEVQLLKHGIFENQNYTLVTD